jgi:hypothetical protein
MAIVAVCDGMCVPHSFARWCGASARWPASRRSHAARFVLAAGGWGDCNVLTVEKQF